MSFNIVEQIFIAVPAPRMFVVLALTIIALEVFYAGLKITKIKPTAIAEQGQKRKRLAEHRVLESGVPGKAKILDIQPTGTMVNRQPQVRLILEVVPEQGERYETKITKLNIKIDPNDKSKVAIESAQR